MTAPEPRVALSLTAEDTGTLLGALAWAMGGIQIMRDRGEAEGDPEFAVLRSSLMPRLERLVDHIAGARQGRLGPDGEAALESAYGDIRRAFETWIHLTAMDTLSVAVAQRLDENDPVGDDADPGRDDPGQGERR